LTAQKNSIQTEWKQKVAKCKFAPDIQPDLGKVCRWYGAVGCWEINPAYLELA